MSYDQAFGEIFCSLYDFVPTLISYHTKDNEKDAHLVFMSFVESHARRK